MLDQELVGRLKRDFPKVRFVTGRRFEFRPPRTVVIGPDEVHAEMLLLHELGHALTERYTFETEVERIRIEAEAWEKARQLATQYGVLFDEETAQDELDTYRDWLHQKSRCPKCGLTRFQVAGGGFYCPRCDL